MSRREAALCSSKGPQLPELTYFAGSRQHSNSCHGHGCVLRKGLGGCYTWDSYGLTTAFASSTYGALSKPAKVTLTYTAFSGMSSVVLALRSVGVVLQLFKLERLSSQIITLSVGLERVRKRVPPPCRTPAF
eukprot:5385109-Amphidinium_carterae.1